jgi:hypothetical protein
MDPDFKKIVIADFPAERDSFVDELVALASGDTKGRGVAVIKTELLRMSNTMSMWTLITDDSDPAFACFPQKCEKLAAIIPEVGDRLTSQVIPPFLTKMFYMLSIIAGRLTLRSSIEEEEHVVKDAQRTELLQLRYGLRALEDDNHKESILRNLWTRLYILNDECICRQCLGMYVPHLSSSATPAI